VFSCYIRSTTFALRLKSTDLVYDQLSLFIAALDQTIIATAVPTIAAELNSSSGYVWIGGAYLLANAAAGPIWAKLSDIWGRKPILLAAVALFFGSSTLCAQAKDMKMLIIGRAFQGTAGGGLIQLVMITICDLFSMRFAITTYS
jgi:MFS family permease